MSQTGRLIYNLFRKIMFNDSLPIKEKKQMNNEEPEDFDEGLSLSDEPDTDSVEASYNKKREEDSIAPESQRITITNGQGSLETYFTMTTAKKSCELTLWLYDQLKARQGDKPPRSYVG